MFLVHRTGVVNISVRMPYGGFLIGITRGLPYGGHDSYVICDYQGSA